MSEANRAFGPSPGEGVPDELLPLYDLCDVAPKSIRDPCSDAKGGAGG